jgi:23S rRNA pseudouridine2605 synthase
MMLSTIRGTGRASRGQRVAFLSWNYGMNSTALRSTRVRPLSSTSTSTSTASASDQDLLESPSTESVRLSKLLSQHATNLAISRRQAERLIQEGQVSLAGKVVRSPHILIDWKDLALNIVLKVQGKAVLLSPPTDKDGNTKIKVPKVWAVHKLAGEVVTEHDPQGRPSMLQRLMRGGVGRVGGQQRHHLKPIGRLDMPTQGLILVTNDGEYARQMELPSNKIKRIYRARVHGRLTSNKLDRIRQGRIRYENVRYGPMKVEVEKSRRGNKSSSNTWVQITSIEGKNRQIRNVFAALGGRSQFVCLGLVLYCIVLCFGSRVWSLIFFC